jgi:predicted GIY-YIG superfamily endonuclease
VASIFLFDNSNLVKMKGFIYKITNSVNDKAYIGQTIMDVRRRFSAHCHPKTACKALGNAIAKYGKGSFDIKIIQEIEAENKLELKAKMNEFEIKAIKDHETLKPSGYNIIAGGKGAIGRQWSPEQRAKFTATKTGMKYGPKTQEQIRNTADKCFKPVRCIETDQKWPSVKACAEFFNVKPKQISRVLVGQRKRLKRKYTLVYVPKQS